MIIDYDKVFEGMEHVQETCIENDKISTCSEAVKKHYDKILLEKENFSETIRQEAIDRHSEPTANSLEIGSKVEEHLNIPAHGIIQHVPCDVFDVEIAKSKLDAENVAELSGVAEHFVVETAQDAQKGISFAMQARKMRNSIEKARKEIVRPHIDFQKSVKKYADEFSKCLKGIEETITKKVEDYQEGSEVAPENIKTEDGTSTTITEWKYEIREQGKIPLKYLMPNDAAIKEDIKKGVRNIPGIKIYEKQRKQYRVK